MPGSWPLGKPTSYRDHQGNPTHLYVFRDMVMSATLCHDTWRTRHSNIMRAITAKAREARLEVEAEVFWLLRDIVPAEAMGELEIVSGRSGCVPDMRLSFPGGPACRLTAPPWPPSCQHQPSCASTMPTRPLKRPGQH